MNRRSFPTGQASTAVLKALLRTLTIDQGPAAADGWLRSIRMVRDDLDDETRLVPLPTVHRALVVFSELASRDAIPRASKYLVAPDVLGVWVRVLRGTTEPSEAFARLDSTDSQYGRTTRWETTGIRRGWWRGHVTIAHDPLLEEDGLLRLARLAELAAIPALFGYSDAAARSLPPGTTPGASLVQDFEVVWSVPDVTIGGSVGGAIGLLLGSAPLAMHFSSYPSSVLLAAGAAVVGGLVGVVRARDRLSRAETHAQQTRVHALERSLSLRESRESGAGGQLEGTVAAGQYRIMRRMGG